MRFDECDRIATCKSALTCNSEVRSTGVPLSAASKAKPIAESVVTGKGVRAFGVSSFECVALCTIRSLTGVCQQCMGPPGYEATWHQVLQLWHNCSGFSPPVGGSHLVFFFFFLF